MPTFRWCCLQPGTNTVVLEAAATNGERAVQTVVIIKEIGARPLPVEIRWNQVTNAQDVGQYVDGKWGLTPSGLRTLDRGYDRLFLIGETNWQDYEVTLPVTIHLLDNTISPLSAGNGIGVVLRFAGHTTGGCRNWPEAQPKWGYQPFGAIGWLWRPQAQMGDPPYIQFYRGDSDATINAGVFPVTADGTYWMKFRCETLPDAADGAGVTRYCYKLWAQGTSEPGNWSWQQVQTSQCALRRGGLALVANNVDATFGDILIQSLMPNVPPAVSLTAPANHAVFDAPAIILLAAEASDTDGSVTNVEFYVKGVRIGADDTRPYTCLWSNVPPGTYTLTAQATDDKGGTSLSAPITLLVTGAGGQMVGSIAPAATVYNLTALGRSDWAHWGRGGVYGRFDHKNSGGGQIGNATVIGAGEVHGGRSDPLRKATWTDAMSGITATEDTGYIRSYGATNSGFSFTVPADPTLRTLFVYCGGNSAAAILTAHLSDGAAADFTDVRSSSGSYMNLYALEYRAGSSGQALTVSYLKAANLAGTNGSVDLKAAWLLDGSSNKPPSTGIAFPTNQATASSASDLPISAWVSDSDGTIANVEFFAGSQLLGADSTSPYSITWSNVPAGRYLLSTRAADNLGAWGYSQPTTIVFGASAEPLVSDDFNRPMLNRMLWAIVDPVGGGTVETIGTYSTDARLRITVPGGRNHDAGTQNDSFRLMQAAGDQDFELVAKFDSLPAFTFQFEGILVEDTAGVGLRFNLLRDAQSQLQAYVAKGVGSLSAVQVVRLPIPDIPVPSQGNAGKACVRVKRQAQTWTFWTSPDGAKWTQQALFTDPLPVRPGGPHGGQLPSRR